MRWKERAIRTLLLLLLGASGCSAHSTTAPTPGWHLYHNAKYGYEIQYPEGYEVRETGLEGQRDGASLRIGLKDYQALTPVLDVSIQPGTPATDFSAPGLQAPDLDVRVEDVFLNGVAAKAAEYRWRADGSLAFVSISLPGARLNFMASVGTQDFRASDWWQIVRSFRFTR